MLPVFSPVLCLYQEINRTVNETEQALAQSVDTLAIQKLICQDRFVFNANMS